jgi:hypothetical protein
MLAKKAALPGTFVLTAASADMGERRVAGGCVSSGWKLMPQCHVSFAHLLDVAGPIASSSTCLTRMLAIPSWPVRHVMPTLCPSGLTSVCRS